MAMAEVRYRYGRGGQMLRARLLGAFSCWVHVAGGQRLSVGRLAGSQARPVGSRR